MERKHLEEQKIKESMTEKKPMWSLYYDLKGNDDLMT